MCHEIPLDVPSERITVRELIRERVYQEVQDFNHQPTSGVFCGLVQPDDTERMLNGKRRVSPEIASCNRLAPPV